MGQVEKVGRHATRIYTDDDGYKCISYQGTEVVRFNDDIIILNTGGWFTNTTKRRMNQASNQFGLGITIFQQKWEWYALLDSGKVEPFNGNVLVLFRDKIRKEA